MAGNTSTVTRTGAVARNRTKPSRVSRAAGRQAGLDEVALERVEEEVVDVRPRGIAARPQLGGEVPRRGQGASVEARREARRLAREKRHGEHASRGSRERGPPRRATATVAASHAAANSDAPTSASRTHRAKWAPAGSALRKLQATKPRPAV